MKKILILSSLLVLSLALSLKDTESVTAAPLATPAAKINWMSFDKAAVFMREEPKKVYIDMYTDWCHWCKVMDSKTLSNANVVKYLNENFYCIKFNAESKEDVTFNGIVYRYDKAKKAHELAIELMKGRLSFPTSVFLEENFKTGQPVPGYLKVNDMEMILKYMAEGKNKTVPWTEYQKDFKPDWK